MATKVSARGAAEGPHGEITLARGERLGMRMWRGEEPNSDKPMTTSPHETVGYVISGKAELVVSGETVTLAAGDSYVVPAGAEHTYRILETFTAVEATAPPAG
ncbi:Cupin domain-containing protein [Methylobacterium phyllostachyos]|uniref:Cupin domain-containing protein n=1 Tax=Methylobacterium phyllostachyos TaxID=582672 RepID=A0A1H0JB13_9HYPH|nr:cupin domain-containing protein [Methylobacterium phyllostachyos]SDO40740.1 Cupin domain-containing protein [Methylobacterium phyllostachyos]